MVSEIGKLKVEASSLRKSYKYDEAACRYRSLLEMTGDGYDAAGLIHCLRKLDKFLEALDTVNSLAEDQLKIDWCRNEAIWTKIEGELIKLPEDTTVKNVLQIANPIMALQPTGLSKKTIVFRVLKIAKKTDNWDIIGEWADKVTPEELSNELPAHSQSKNIWSERSIWYNYRIRSFIECHEPEKALPLIDLIIPLYPRQRRFFLRLKAIALKSLKDYPNAKSIYHDLCADSKADWYLLHEYAKLLFEMGETKDSVLEWMCRAASRNFKLETMVNLLADIGYISKDLGTLKSARNHLRLCKLVRERNNWQVPHDVIRALDELDTSILDMSNSQNLTDLYKECQAEWRSKCDLAALPVEKFNHKDLKGQVISVKDERPYCFIKVDSDTSYFCYKSDLPINTTNGANVIFDVVRAIDKKKKKESWKAINVRTNTWQM